MKFKKSFMSLFMFMLLFVFIGCGSDNGGGGFSEATQVSEVSSDVQVMFGANPNKIDTDGDGLTDDFEIQYSYPQHKPDNNDTNGDGILDADEDFDNDGLTALEEQEGKSNPLLADSDLDGLSDKDEIQIHKTNPLKKDTDGDNLSDSFEISVGLNPLKKDTDDNGVFDNDELVKQNIKLSDDISNNVSLQVKGKGDLTNAINVFQASSLNPNLTNLPKQVGKTYTFKISSAISDYTLNFKVDKTKVQDESKLTLFVYDKNLEFWIPAKVQNKTVIDNGDGTLSLSAKIINNKIISKSKIDINESTVSSINFKETIFSYEEISYMTVTDDNFLKDVGGTIERKICIPANEVKEDTDIVFVIDSSGSMETNDPTNLRITGAQKFLTAFSPAIDLKIGDRGAVVDFDDGAKLLQALTTDTGIIYEALNQIDSSGGTNIGAGVDVAITELLNADNFDKNKKVIILLTDGKGSYDASLTDKAKANNITILTIGLSSNVDDQLLFDIANTTGGVYKQIDTDEKLVQVFKDFEKTLGDDGTDTDGDGLTDCAEYLGMYLMHDADNSGNIVTTDPNNPDSDDDGILDGEEIFKTFVSKGNLDNRTEAIIKAYEDGGIFFSDEEKRITRNILKYGLYTLSSHPNSKDSDGDGLPDGLELELGSDPLSKDTDSDKLEDDEELSYNTDLHLRDTDGDGLDDYYEVNNDTDPTIFDKKYKAKDVLFDSIKGIICGALEPCEDESKGTYAYIVGNLVSGYLVFGDARDITYQVWEEEYVDATITAIGFIPVYGDAVKTPAVIIKSLKHTKNPSMLMANVLKYVSSVSDEIALKVIQNYWADSYKFLTKTNTVNKLTYKFSKISPANYSVLSNANILQFVKSGRSIKNLVNGINGSVSSKNINNFKTVLSVAPYARNIADFQNGYFTGRKGWKLAEDYLRALDGIPNYSKALKTKEGKIRYPDYWDEVNKVMKEAKTGYQNNKKLLEQIKRDKQLLADRVIKKIEWHFFPSGRSHTIGAKPEIIKALQDAKIPYHFHLP